MMLHSCIKRASNYIKYFQQILYLHLCNILHKIYKLIDKIKDILRGS